MNMRENKKTARSAFIRQNRSQEIWRQFRKNKGAMAGLVVFCAIVLVAVFSGIIWSFDNDIVKMHASQRLLTPRWGHVFGTDHMGRDLLARVCYGARYSLLIGVVAVSVSVVFGSIIGSVAGYYGGKIETAIMRIVEMLLMIPSILLVITIIAAFGVSLMNLMLALGIATIPHFARNARASVLTVRTNEYVEAAKAVGVGDFFIIFKHVIPNAFSPIIVQATTRIASCIIDAAAFSFLGLGVPAPLPEWGALLSDARPYLRQFPHLALFPGLAIMITVLSINLIGDGLRDALDPKLKR
jgi:peptide/nickel transport system permease protein